MVDLTCVGKHWRSSWLKWWRETLLPQHLPPHGSQVQPQSWTRSTQEGEKVILRHRPFPFWRSACFWDPTVRRLLLSANVFSYCLYFYLPVKQKAKTPWLMLISIAKRCSYSHPTQRSQSNPNPIIPHICHFSYTHIFWGLKILHSKARKFTTNFTHCV